MLQMVVAEKLGMGLCELQQKLTYEELVLWSLFYEIRAEEEKAAMEKAKRRRR